MRRLVTIGTCALLTLAGCAQPAAGPGNTPGRHWERFTGQATTVAEAWRAADLGAAWRTGYVPLQEPTVLPADPGFDNDTKQAFLAGWYRAEVPLGSDRPAEAPIHFPDGATLTVPLISADEAYQQLDQGDPPPCPQRPTVASPDPTASPDHSVGSPLIACIPLTVTAATLGTVTVRTSRGEAQVPAWLFTIAELTAPIARVAVAPTEVGRVPELPAPTRPAGTGLVAAQDLIAVDGAVLTYRLGVGACDTDITPLVLETDDVVVVAGGVTPSDGNCTDQLLLEQVTYTLGALLGARPVLDAFTGKPLIVTTSRPS